MDIDDPRFMDIHARLWVLEHWMEYVTKELQKMKDEKLPDYRGCP